MKKYTVKVTVASHLKCDAAFKRLFHKILLDYCKRFSVKVLPGNWSINVIAAGYSPEDGAEGVMTRADHKIIIQVNDPYMTAVPHNKALDYMFVTALCHEFVHACQQMTGRPGLKLNWQIECDTEEDNTHQEYIFDPEEVEARILDEFYVGYTPSAIWDKLKAAAATEA